MSSKSVAPARSLSGTIALTPDKSIAQRAAIFSLLHKGPSTIYNYSQAKDPQTTLQCVQNLGAKVEIEADKISIYGVGREGISALTDELDCGNSGTAMRLLSGLLTGVGLSIKLIGDHSLSRRTMSRIISPLEKMGADILARNGVFAPLYISRENPLKALEFTLPIPSAQLKSCILLAGLFGEEESCVIETIPSRDHTERLLQLRVETNALGIRLSLIHI